MTPRSLLRVVCSRRVALTGVLAGTFTVSACGGSDHPTGGAGQSGSGGSAGASSGGTGAGAGDGTGGVTAGSDSGTGGGGAAGGGTDACTGSCAPVVCEGSYDILSEQDFDAFVALRCREVTGTLRIAQTTLSALTGLIVERIGGDLFVVANPSLTDLDGLERVRTIVGNLNIVDNLSLASLVPLNSWPADAVGGDLAIFDNPELPQCDVNALDVQLTANCVNCGANGPTCP